MSSTRNSAALAVGKPGDCSPKSSVASLRYLDFSVFRKRRPAAFRLVGAAADVAVLRFIATGGFVAIYRGRSAIRSASWILSQCVPFQNNPPQAEHTK
jgi:hypothetical protein